MKKAYNCVLEIKKEIARGIFDFTVISEEIAKEAKPGQFLHITCSDAVFLRRPISICDAGNGRVRFIFEIKGKGTEELAKKELGDAINIMGPLGNGFTISDEYKNAAIIGGGIGVFPLYMLAKQVRNPAVFLGFRSRDRVVMEEEFEKISDLQLATDDGSHGYHGYAVELLKQHLSQKPCDIIYACGPVPMLKAVQGIAAEAGIKCQLSMEQRMGCGIGACLVCTCETTRPGTEKMARACKNGPVFWAEEVVF